MVKFDIRSIGTIRVIDIVGALREPQPFLNVLARTIQSGQNKIICNMEQVEYISPETLSALSKYLEQVRQSRGDIKLCNIGKIRGIIEFSGFLYQTYRDVLHATQSFQHEQADMYADTIKPQRLVQQSAHQDTILMLQSQEDEPVSELLDVVDMPQKTVRTMPQETALNAIPTGEEEITLIDVANEVSQLQEQMILFMKKLHELEQRIKSFESKHW